MDKFLHFKASSNIKSLVGRDLVTDEVAAVFELVKNSYDADAKEVKIEFLNLKNGIPKLIISDNGTGMDLQDIQDRWMVIGTDSKKKVGYSPKYKRPLNGDKGIGRFSVDRLGKKLKLNTIKENSSQRIEMDFDWNLFDDNYSNLEDIEFPYDIDFIHEESFQGVKLEIDELRDDWTERKVDLLIKNLRHFKSPFKVNDNFKIIVAAPDYFSGWKYIEPYDLAEISPLWIKTSITEENPEEISIKVYRDGVEYVEVYENSFGFGSVYSEIYFFDKAAKVKFYNKMNMLVKDFGNIRLYRDDFRIHPYGEQSNDWLQLDRRKAQGIARYFGTRDVIGFVQITKEHNPNIKVLTNRQGLIENEYYNELLEFIMNFSVKPLEKYFFKKPENEVFERSKENVKNSVLELNRVAKTVEKTDPNTAKVLRQISQIVQKSQSDQVEFVKNQEELLKVYRRNASKELLLHKIIHEGLIRIERVKTVASSAQRKIRRNLESPKELISFLGDKIEKIDNITGDAKEYLLTARDHIIRSREKEKVYFNVFVQEQFEDIKEQLVENNIDLNIEIRGDIHYIIDKEDIKTIFNNFISNAIKSLKQIERERKIKITITESKKFIILIFEDNGVGIPKDLRDRIFDPFYSTYDEGFGMGLSIVDEIVKEYKGELNLGINKEIGAEFHVKLRK
ncbi:hypothetical protein CN449_18840 [Bacillus thuringiensis]|uniref:sensor histidine kinase n=1 Tax=Bacillus thuringiensis TaxID=1428 RepID=UPI000BED012F|nr:sensor histidine kinase [Bacillus thuringiensis]PDY61241.1 hypothetical protein COM87_03565 [Bacillus thuringiensis]PEW71984.1 hypothetical protein CN449_18840 [Bacillus thuringiensis]PFA26872.1 hypothetical protein CN384_15190 [Bacillus thuringiensis]PFD31566.1 hypothetical protein CN269_07225 [Bacillus thuringiensis]PGN20669.1 hypothetical protein CN951_16460 [Bacillus thuringiensis]